MDNLPVAYVLTWNSHTTRIRCPYSCRLKFHSHGSTLPRRGRHNARAAHCPLVHDESGLLSCKGYRLLYPFEKEARNKGYWSLLDRVASRWRTIGWDLHDPEYDLERASSAVDMGDVGSERNAQDPSMSDESRILPGCRKPDTAGQMADELVTALSGLGLGCSQEKLIFDSLCVCNEVTQAKVALMRTKDPRALISKTQGPGDKPVLLMACEEGHAEIVDLLLEYEVPLEDTDSDGNTALHKALQYGYGIVANRLITAGANIHARSSDGQEAITLATYALQEQSIALDAERDLLALTGFDFFDDTRKLANKRRIRKRLDEIEALKLIIERCEIMDTQRQVAHKLKRIVAIHGDEQLANVKQHGNIDNLLIVNRILRKISDTPRTSLWKTVACLVRGDALPYVFAVSGYAAGSQDGALNRELWRSRVSQLASIMNYELPKHEYDEEGKPGSFFACHSEKQLLAYLLWNHTKAFGTADLEDPAVIEDIPAPSLDGLVVEICVCQPGTGDAYVCPDCLWFCNIAASLFGFRLRLVGGNTNPTRLLHDLPSVCDQRTSGIL